MKRLVTAIIVACAFGSGDALFAQNTTALSGRVGTEKKGSLLFYSKVELRWNAAGALVQDTVLSLLNDYPADVRVQLFFVNGDEELDPIFSGGPFPILIADGEPGCNFVDCAFELTSEQPVYWSAASGDPLGCQPFDILDPDLGSGPGRPDPEGSTDRVLRGFVIGWAVDAVGDEIYWNHLSGKGILVNYADTSAWEYSAWAFQSHVSSAAAPIPVVRHPDPGLLRMDGSEYDYSFDMLLFDFFGAGSLAFSRGGTSVTADTDLTLHLLDHDFRENSLFGLNPPTTKAHFDIWNMNERKLSNTRRCISCWDQTLISSYSAPNNMLLINLGSDKGKARIDGLQADECEENCLRELNGDLMSLEDILDLLGDLFGDVHIVCSRDASLLGVAAKHLTFSGGSTATAGSELVGMGQQPATLIAGEFACDDGLFCNGEESFDPNTLSCVVVSACPPAIDGCVTVTGACIEETDTCVRAESDAFCDDGLFCTGSETCAPEDPTADDDNCVSSGDPCTATGEVCDEADEECVECLTDAHCADTPDTPFCDAASNTCVECLTAAHCDDSEACTGDSCSVSGECTYIPVAAGGPQQSSPIALACDDRLANVNPDSDSMTLFDASVSPPSFIAEIEVGHDPRSVAIVGGKAYVANSRDGTVSIVRLVSQMVVGTVPVGAEPMGVMASPNRSRLYVANFASNNVSVLNTQTDTIIATIDLSAFGTAPQALAMSNDGDSDDTDELIFVAMFYAQLRPGKGAVDEGQDDQRQGHVVAISAATNTVLGAPNPVVLGPMANSGFNSNGQLVPANGTVPAIASANPQFFATPTGAFPNQLASIALHPTSGRGYVVSTGASPNGPFRFNVNTQGLLSVFITSTRTEVLSAQTASTTRQTAPLNLNQGVNLATTPAPRLFMSNPVAMAWRPDGSDAWIVIQNSDLVVRATVDANGIPTVGAPLVAGPSQIVRVDVHDQLGVLTESEAPRGIVIDPTGARAYVSNFISRTVTEIDISNPTAPSIVDSVPSSDLPISGSAEEEALLGASLFFTGRGPQERMSSESWGGCIVCHPNGRSDNVTWMFDAGPRQTIALDGMFNKTNPLDQRILNWSAVRDENHDFELNTRAVFGGRGLIEDDRLFLAIGGAAGSDPTDSDLIEQFQQFTGVVSTNNDLSNGIPLPTLIGERRDFGIATLPDDRVYIIGGRSGIGQGSLIGAIDAVLEFNPRTNSLVQRSSIGFTPRHSLGAAAVMTSLGVRIYAIGGYTATDATTAPTGLAQEYNPATDTWRTVATMPAAAAQFGVTVAGGINTAEPLQLIHAVSGNIGSESAPALSANFVVQRFQADPTGPGTWSTFNVTGLTPRRNHGAATALRGVSSRVFVIGGQDAAGTVVDTVEEYLAQAVTGVAGAHTSLPAPRARFGIGSTLSSNQIYVMGGADGTGVEQSSVFEYTIASNGPVAGPPGTPSGAWVTRGNLSVARQRLGVSTPPGVTNFLPVANEGRDEFQDAMAAWVASVRSSRAPVAPTDPAAMTGRTLFGTTGLVIPGFSCATCHGGAKWTRSTVDYDTPPSAADNIGFGNENVIGAELRKTSTQPGVFPGVLLNVGTFTPNAPAGRVNEIRSNSADISQAIAPLGANGFNIPSLLSVHETRPYFYSGLAQTLEEVLNGSQDGNGGTRHHFVSSPADRANLIAFLRSIDQTTPIFP